MICEMLFGLRVPGLRSGRVLTGAGADRDSTLVTIFGERGKTVAGPSITEDTALNLSAVYAAVRLISWTRAVLPLKVYRRMSNGDKQEDPRHPVWRLLQSRPNPDMTPMVFRSLLSSYELLWGNSFCYVETGRDGKPVALWPLPADRVGVLRTERRELAYEVSRIKDRPTSKAVLAQSEVLHVPNVVGAKTGDELAGVMGQSVIGYAREQLGEAAAAQEFGGGFFAGGAEPGLVLKHPGRLKDPDKLRKNWMKIHGGPERRVAVLEEGMDLTAVGMPLKDAQFLESRQFHVVEIARWFGVPPHKLRDLSRATFSNIAEQKLEWYEDLLPWLVLTEQEYGHKLFTPAEHDTLFVEHVVEGLLRGDIEKRYAAFAVAIQWGFMSRNEVRRRENLNSLGPEGDVYLIPANMIAAEAVNKEPPKPADEKSADEKPASGQPGANGKDDRASATPRQREIARGALQDLLARWLRRQVAEARAAAKEPRSFTDWIDRYYDSLRQILRNESLLACSILGVQAGRLAASHAERQRQACLEIAGRATPEQLRQAVSDATEAWLTAAGEETARLLEDPENACAHGQG